MKILTNPYSGLRSSGNKTIPHRLNLDIPHDVALALNSVLARHGDLTSLVNTIIHELHTSIITNSWSFTDRDALIARCAEGFTLGHGPDHDDNRAAPPVHTASAREVCGKSDAGKRTQATSRGKGRAKSKE